MTESPKLQMIGEGHALACADGVCDLPETATSPEPPR